MFLSQPNGSGQQEHRTNSARSATELSARYVATCFARCLFEGRRRGCVGRLLYPPSRIARPSTQLFAPEAARRAQAASGLPARPCSATPPACSARVPPRGRPARPSGPGARRRASPQRIAPSCRASTVRSTTRPARSAPAAPRTPRRRNSGRLWRRARTCAPPAMNSQHRRRLVDMGVGLSRLSESLRAAIERLDQRTRSGGGRRGQTPPVVLNTGRAASRWRRWRSASSPFARHLCTPPGSAVSVPSLAESREPACVFHTRWSLERAAARIPVHHGAARRVVGRELVAMIALPAPLWCTSPGAPRSLRALPWRARAPGSHRPRAMLARTSRSG